MGSMIEFLSAAYTRNPIVSHGTVTIQDGCGAKVCLVEM